MKKVIRAHRGGFTLVELLIVIMIIAILAGMMMLATGGATDSATATRIINDLRSFKSGVILAFADSGESPADYTNGTLDPFELFNKVGKFIDRDSFQMPSAGSLGSGGDAKYQYMPMLMQATVNDAERTLILFDLASSAKFDTDITPGVRKKLTQMAEKAGLYDDKGELYSGGDSVGMVCF